MLKTTASRSILCVLISLAPVLNGCTAIKTGLNNISQAASGNPSQSFDFSQLPEMDGYAPTVRASKDKRAFQISVARADGQTFKSFVIDMEKHDYGTDAWIANFRDSYFSVENLEIYKRRPDRASKPRSYGFSTEAIKVMGLINQARFDAATADGVDLTPKETEWVE